jgi:phosphoenolpyruvate carboxylase
LWTHWKTRDTPSLNDMGGAESLQSLMQRVRRHGLEKEMRAMLAEYAVRVVLTSHPTQFYPWECAGDHH